MRRQTLRNRLPVGLLAAMGLVLTAFAATAAPTPADDVGALARKGFAAMHAGEVAAASAAFEAAARVSDQPAMWWMRAGDVHLRAGEPEQALAVWSEGVAAIPQAAETTVLLERIAFVAARSGNVHHAALAEHRLVKALARAVEAGRTSPMAWQHHQPLEQRLQMHLALSAEMSAMSGEFTRAEKDARALIRRAPAAPDGYAALGYVLLQAAEFDDAIAAFDEALRLDPTHAAALNNLGTAFYMKHDLDAAEAQFEAVLSSPAANDRSQSIALSNLAELLMLQGAYEDAERLYRDAIEACPDGAWSYMGLAATYDVSGRYDEAINTMIDGWERDSNGLSRVNTHFFQPEWAWQRDALIAEIEGEPKTAIALWRKVAVGKVGALVEAARYHLTALALDK
ncbi:MAG: tetratricopeptide repeat protein [Myxococcales bacterium]|nr:tetratricopeptide repeat protein [Myxococcales bacterium]